MRRKDKEISDQQIIEKILSASEICRIAISDADTSYVVPLYYGYRDHHLYFHSASQGRKIALLEKNNRVCFEIEYAHEIIKRELSCGWTSKYRSVIGYGHIEILKEAAPIKAGLDIIMQHYGRMENSYEEKYLQRIVILKLKIDSISGKQSGDWDD